METGPEEDFKCVYNRRVLGENLSFKGKHGGIEQHPHRAVWQEGDDSMEQIFINDTASFMGKMKDLSAETVEAYSEYLYSSHIPEDKRLCFALLKIVYTYVKENRSKRDWQTSTLLFFLYKIASSREVLFMRTADNAEEVRKIREAFREDSQKVINMAVLAGMNLEYYYRVFEKEYHTAAYSKMICLKMKQLMSVETTLADKVKMGIEKEKPMPVGLSEGERWDAWKRLLIQ